MTKLTIVLAMAGISATPVGAIAGAHEGLSNKATITLSEARVIASKACPGRILDEELEKEAGGSGLRYSFDIRRGQVTWEVGVDARSGQVLENAPEGSHSD